MTLVPRTGVTTFDPNATTAIDSRPEAVAAPNAVDLTAAAFRQENIVGSLAARPVLSFDREDGFNVWDQIKGTKYEPYWDDFADVFNTGAADAKKRQIDMELADRNTIAAGGGWGIVATIGAGVFSPENLIPGGAIIKGVKGGAAIVKSALSGASAAAIGAATSEAVLRATQTQRTDEESLFNIGGAMLLGGTLGAGASALFTKSDFARLGKAMDRETVDAVNSNALAENERLMMQPASAGAAARPVATLDENTIAGTAAQIAGGAVRGLNPVLRILHSSSPVTREIGTRLFENPVYMKKNLAGVASDPSVETLVKEFTQGAMARSVENGNTIYKQFRTAGGTLDREQFNIAVGKAMRRNDQADDPLISQAAASWRKSLYDPLKDHAIEAGLLPKDVSVDTALSYFTRVYNRPLIEAREQEFKGIVRQYIAREVRNAEIRTDLSRIDGTRVEAPTKSQPAFVNDADRAAYVDQIVDDIFNTLTGRNADGDIPRDIVASTRGPLKERTFNIPDEMIEEYLESNVEAVARRYARTMSSDIEMTKAFGKADMKEQIAQIKADYQRQREAAQKNVDPETGEALKKPLTQAQIEKRIKELVAAEKNDVRDIQALRDMIRGTYLAKENSTSYARVARVAGTTNYLRTMGGVTVSSLTDVARHVMVHGFSGVMRDGLLPMIKNLKGFKMAVGEAKVAGAVTDRLLNTRMATWADITDPYSVSSPFERFMDNTANGFSRLNGLVYWNDFQKSFASVITQNRVLRGAGDYARLGNREQSYLAYLGIDGSMAERIAKQFELHGSMEDGGIRVAGTDDWDDDWARRVYRAAVNKDVDTTIITKGVGDVPLFMNTPTGRLLMQFKGFAIASHQRALMRGLQERPMGFVSGTMFATAVGMLIYYLKSVESNRINDLSDNPGRWIAEGLDRSGLFSVAFEANNTIEKGFGIGAYGAMMSLFPDADQAGKASKYASRSVVSSFTGPTGDLIDTLFRAGNAIKGAGDGWTEGDLNSIKKLVPGATLPGIRSLVEYLGMPAVRGGLAID